MAHASFYSQLPVADESFDRKMQAAQSVSYFLDCSVSLLYFKPLLLISFKE
jgi:hypothetical protein